MSPLSLLCLTPALVLYASNDDLRAQYAWGYAGADGTGKGTVAILINPDSGKLVVELHGVGERLVLLEGDTASGYHLKIPRREIDTSASTLAELPVPFLPALGSPQALHALLTQGKGPGVKVQKTDGEGPVKLRYTGKDPQGREVTVWLQRTRWETGKPKA